MEIKNMETTYTEASITIVWTVTDILDMLPDLNDNRKEVGLPSIELTYQDACNILNDIKNQHDATVGINWNLINDHILAYTEN